VLRGPGGRQPAEGRGGRRGDGEPKLGVPAKSWSGEGVRALLERAGSGWKGEQRGKEPIPALSSIDCVLQQPRWKGVVLLIDCSSLISH